MYSKPSATGAALAAGTGTAIFGGATWTIIAAITALVTLGLITLRIATRRGRR